MSKSTGNSVLAREIFDGNNNIFSKSFDLFMQDSLWLCKFTCLQSSSRVKQDSMKVIGYLRNLVMIPEKCNTPVWF